jgi:hypothetical protein
MKIAQTAAMFMGLKRGGRAERAAGGLAGRHGYALDGMVDDGTGAYDSDDGTGAYASDDPTDHRRFITQPDSQMEAGPVKQPTLLDSLGSAIGQGTHAVQTGLGAAGNAVINGMHAWDKSMDDVRAARANDPVMYSSGHYYSQKDGLPIYDLPKPGTQVLDNANGKYFVYGQKPIPAAPAPAPAPAQQHGATGSSTPNPAAPPPHPASPPPHPAGLGAQMAAQPSAQMAAQSNVGAQAPVPMYVFSTPTEAPTPPQLASGTAAQDKTGLAGAVPPADHAQAAPPGQPGGGGFFSDLLHGAPGALDRHGQPVAHLADGVTDVAGNVLTGLGRGAMNYTQKLKSGDEQAWVPLLTALSAMGTAPTRSLGVALASGVGAGAEAYPALQTQQAKLQSQRLLNSGQAAKIAKTGLAGGPAAPGQPGINMGGENVGFTSTVPAVKQAFQPTIVQPAPPPEPGAPLEYRNNPVGMAGKQFASNAMGNYFLADDAAKANAPQDYARISNEYRAANDGRVNLDALESSVIGTIHQKGGTGPYTSLASGWMAVANQIATALGLPPPDPAMAANPQLMLKYATDLAAARAQAGDQRSAEALGTLAKTVPSPDMTPDANAQLMAALKIQNQTAIDRGVYRSRVEAMGATPGRYLPSDLEQSFRQDVTNEQQAKDKDALAGLYMSEVGKNAKGNGISKFQMLKQQIQAAPSKEARGDMLRKIDTRYGPGFHRYFTGGQW